MRIHVDTDDLATSAAAVRAVGSRIDGYADRLGARSSSAAAGLDDDVRDAVRTATAELEDAVRALAAGYRQYGGALGTLVARYTELERAMTAEKR